MDDYVRFEPMISDRLDILQRVKNMASKSTIDRIVYPEPRPTNSVSIAYDDVTAKTEIYRLLCEGKNAIAIARRMMDVNDKELDKCKYYRISGKDIDARVGDFTAKITPSQCNEHNSICPYKSSLEPPIELTTHPKGERDFFELVYQWKVNRDFLISKRIYNAFKEEKITGIEYTDVGMENDVNFAEHSSSYVWARPTHYIYASARELRPINWYCQKHGYAKFFDAFDYSINDDDINGVDVVEILGTKSNKMQINALHRDRLVSSRVVKILLRDKAKGLLGIGAHGEKYDPICVTEHGAHPVLG